MEKQETYLFIGGPLDGKRIMTGFGLDTFKTTYNGEELEYEMQSITYKNNFYCFWVIKGMTKEQALIKLFTCYRPENEHKFIYENVEGIEYKEMIDKHLAEGGMLYTESEGSRWQKLETDLTVDEVIVKLYDKENWITTNSSAPGHISRTSLVNNKGDVKIVDAVKFPNGRIWHSYFRKFRDEIEEDSNANKN